MPNVTSVSPTTRAMQLLTMYHTGQDPTDTSISFDTVRDNVTSQLLASISAAAQHQDWASLAPYASAAYQIGVDPEGVIGTVVRNYAQHSDITLSGIDVNGLSDLKVDDKQRLAIFAAQEHLKGLAARGNRELQVVFEPSFAKRHADSQAL